MRFSGCLIFTILQFMMPAHADAADNLLSKIDEDPISSPRTRAMGGATGTVADDLDAAFNNPAGIGGLRQKSEAHAPLIRKLYLPAVTVETNANGPALVSDLKNSGASGNSAAGQAVFDSRGNVREYARLNIVTGMVFGRSMLIPFSDTQIAVTPRGDGSGTIDTHYRNMNGVGYGLSLQNPSGNVSLGYFGYAAERKETDGPLVYSDLIDRSQRSAALRPISKNYSGAGNNFGGIWRMDYEGSPTLGLNVKNAGDTTFKAGNGDTLVVKQEDQASFSLSPRLGHSAVLNFVAQGNRLEEKKPKANRRYHLGTELLLGKGPGSYSGFALRAGYCDAGGSAGLALHMGMIGLDFSVYSVDISADSSRYVERRGSVMAFLNVAEF